MKNCTHPTIMVIKPNLSLNKSYNEVWRNFQNEAVSRIGVFQREISSQKFHGEKFAWGEIFVSCESGLRIEREPEL